MDPKPGNVDDALSGSSHTFTCNTGGSSSDLSFYHNGEKLEDGVNGVGVIDGTLTIASTTTDHTGMYQCIVENDSGSDGTSWYLIVRDPSEWRILYYTVSNFMCSHTLS